MEKQFHNEDFERFLRDNANQYRMYPSEKVWKGIYSTLHTRRRWYGFGAFALLLISGTLISLFVLNNDSNSNSAIQKQTASVSTTTPANAASTATVTNDKKDPDNGSSASGKTTAAVPLHLPAAIKPAASISNGNDIEKTEVNTAALTDESKTNTLQSAEVTDEKNKQAEETNSLAITENDIQPPAKQSSNTTDKNLSGKKSPASQSDINKAVLALASQNAPVSNTKKQPRFTAQAFFTPAISYRKLSENKAYAVNPNAQSFNYIQFIDVNNLVKHKPAMGLEFGIEGRYKVNNTVAATAGLQFNINRYDIRAYFHPTEFATIALNSGGYRPDTLTTLSNYRNFDGYSPNWIENFYFQVSVPVGAEFTLVRSDKFEWGIAGSIQPTYIIGDRAYLITTDYKNYVKVPNLMRRWNLNTGLGAFVSYSTGRIKWQVGPQLRYQHFSSFENIYPVKENLFNVGLKVGAKINKK